MRKIIFAALVFLLAIPAVPVQAGTDHPCDPSAPKREFMACHERQTAALNALADSRKVVGGWSVGCHQDKVTLEWTCFAVKWVDPQTGGNSLRISHHPVSGFCFMGALNDHPGRTAIIRIGDNEPIRYPGSSVCGGKASEIIDQLMTEADGATRGTRWPARTHEFEFSAVGFPAAWQALQERIENPRP